jgi:hypothetical protein
MNSSLKRSLLLGGILALSLTGIVSAAVISWEIAREVGWGGTYVVLTPSYKAKGSNQPYDFVDETAFRTTGTFYKYRITAVYSSGARSDPYEIGVSHTVSSVRRTWGSIKAMFR